MQLPSGANLKPSFWLLAVCCGAVAAAPPRKATILWLDHAAAADANNQLSYGSVLELLGYQTKVSRLSKFTLAPAESDAVLVVPRGAGARFSQKQQQEILEYLAAGGLLVADGRQAWLEKLGFRWSGQSASVSTVTDLLYPEMSLYWQGQDPVERFTPPGGVRELMVDKESGQVLALAGRQGAGRYLYLAAPLDPHTGDAVSHYPYFPQYLAETFGGNAPARSPRLEAYFDPAFRAGADPERLAASWQGAGIHTIYAAAWQQPFPYGDLVQACHQRGLKVYAWLAFPMVTRKVWDEHPEWRERTAAGADGHIGWRYSMNLQDPACFRAAMDWMTTMLRAHPWDGVNLAELNYDADFNDYLRADRFVPMNDDVRREFQRRAGFDPALLFQAGFELLPPAESEGAPAILAISRGDRTGLAPPCAGETRSPAPHRELGGHRDYAGQPARRLRALRPGCGLPPYRSFNEAIRFHPPGGGPGSLLGAAAGSLPAVCENLPEAGARSAAAHV